MRQTKIKVFFVQNLWAIIAFSSNKICRCPDIFDTVDINLVINNNLAILLQHLVYGYKTIEKRYLMLKK